MDKERGQDRDRKVREVNGNEGDKEGREGEENKYEQEIRGKTREKLKKCEGNVVRINK